MLFKQLFKTTFSKSKLEEIIYRNFKQFNEENFNQELLGKLSVIDTLINNYSLIENRCN